MYRLALDHKARQIVLIAGILLAASLLALFLHRSASAQDNAIEFPENSKDAVATFTADDPEGATPIAWDLVEDASDPDGDGDLTAADNADAAVFAIDKDGVLKFSSPPDFENPATTNATANTYKVVVVACDVALVSDACPTTAKAGYHAVTVKVTKVDEPGKVTLSATGDGTPQYLVGTTLTAEASDGDITDATQTFTVDRAGEVTGVVWRWYRGSAQISEATSNAYTLNPDDEGQQIRAVVFYVVEGNVDQEEASVTTDYPVLARRVGANLLKFPATVSRTITEGAKDRNVGDPVTATGNHGTVEYSLVAVADNAVSTDVALFKIDKKTGQITTDVVLDYESSAVATATTPGSCSGADGTDPDRTCVVVVTARDSTGEAPTTEATVTIKITDVDEAPTFSTGAQAVGVPENSTDLFGSGAGYSGATDVAGVTYTATDPEGRTVSYSLAGPDASKFQLSNDPPSLSFVSKPDFEAKASADGDNVYEVTIRATAGGKTGERAVRVTVGNVDEGPGITGPSTRNFVENSKDPVATYMAKDPEGATPITWSVATAAQVTADDDLADADNADAEHFAIDKDGMLKFSSPPDYENPSGEGATSNTYKVVVAACDVSAADCTGGNLGFYKVTVTVTKVDEQGKVTLATDTTDGTPQYLVGATLTAEASDGDITDATQTFTVGRAGEVTGVVWRWYRGGGLIPGADAEDNTYTLLPEDEGQRIRVEVRYTVAGNTKQEIASLTTEHPVLKAREGDNALKFDPAAVSRTITEGAKDRNVGAPVTATDNHGTIRYTLAGTDGTKFEIDDKTGQITTNAVLDYEASAGDDENCTVKNSCEVTVAAKDSTGDDSTNSAAVTIKITDVDEKPDFSTGAKAIDVPEGSTALWHGTTTGYSATAVTDVTYTAMDPERRTVTYSLAGPDASKFQNSGSPPVLSFVSKPDFEAKASADGDNVYEVTIRATAGGKTGERAVRVTVADVNEAPVIVRGGLLISGRASVDVEENSVDVATYTLTGPNKAMASWSRSGDDASHFSISSSGVLTFASAPNFEAPASMDGDNVYKVTLTANDGTYMDTHDVEVTVTNAEEDGTVTLTSAPYLVGEMVTATLMDPDQNVTGEAWQWSRGDMADGSDATDIDGANSASYTLVTDDDGMYLTATVSYTDAAGDDSADATTSEAVTSNRAPEFDATDNTRAVDENSAEGTAVGMPVTATDADGDTLSYSLSGTDAASFAIDSSTGQISVGTGTALDYETKTSYSVTVTATDPSGSTDSVDVTINVNNVGLTTKYDADDSGTMERAEVVMAINDYLDGGADAPDKAEVVRLIDLYLGD